MCILCISACIYLIIYLFLYKQNNLFLRNGRAPVLRRSLVVAFRFENGPPLCRRLRNGGPQLDKGSGCQSGHGYGYLRKLVSATPCPCLNAYCYCVRGFLKIHSQMRLPPNNYLFPPHSCLRSPKVTTVIRKVGMARSDLKKVRCGPHRERDPA